MRYGELTKQIALAVGATPLRGVVVGVVADRLQVATPQGLRELALQAGINKGDEVTIISGRVTKQSGKNAEVYFV